MPFILPFLPAIIGAGGAIAAAEIGSGGSGSSGSGSGSGSSSGAGTDIAGRPIDSSAILPGKQTPLYPDLQSGWGSFLQSMLGKGATPYGGALSPDTSQTMLPNVWNNWQPWNAGTSYIADTLGNNKLGIGQPNPILQNMMQYGGAGGPGNNAMNNAMLFGAPSQAGQYASNLAQFGVSGQRAGMGLANQTDYGISGEGAGRPLANLAYGINTSGPGSYLTPFLTGQGYPGYRTPPIPASTFTVTQR